MKSCQRRKGDFSILRPHESEDGNAIKQEKEWGYLGFIKHYWERGRLVHSVWGVLSFKCAGRN